MKYQKIAHSLMFLDVRWHSPKFPPALQLHFFISRSSSDSSSMSMQSSWSSTTWAMGLLRPFWGHHRWQWRTVVPSVGKSWKAQRVFKSFPVFISGDMLKFWYWFAISRSWWIGGVLEGAIPVPGMGRSSWKDFMLGVVAVSVAKTTLKTWKNDMPSHVLPLQEGVSLSVSKQEKIFTLN